MRSGLFLWLGLAASSALGAQQPTEACGVCHPQVRVEAEGSAHAAEGVGCTDCHGGDAEARTVQAAHGGSFRPLTDRRSIPSHCASCHSDLDRMRAYNLPIDQYAIYSTSAHGKAIAAGEMRAAVCTDCHGVHGIRGPDEPTSPIYPRNLPATCGRCHGDAARMGPFGLDAGLVEDYRQGRHGIALLEQGNAAAPSCVNCHGVHGATPPGIGDIDKVCGSCHEQTRRAFLAGPHGEGMAAAGLPECASCHSNHRIAAIEEGSLDSLCIECHGDGSDAEAVGRSMLTLLTSAREQVGQAESLVLEASEGPIHVEDYLSRLEEAKTYLTEAAPLLHSVSVEPIEAITRRARSIAEEVQHELYEKLDRRSVRLLLVLAWFYLILTLAILIGYKRRLRRRSASE